jgi:hypothetical protein
LAVFAVGVFTAAFLTAVFFWAGAAFLAARFAFALYCAERRLAASWIAFLPVALSLRSFFVGSLEVFAVPEDGCDLTAAFTRATASFAS